MQVISGNAIDVKSGSKTVRGWAMRDFDTDAEDEKFDLHIIKKDGTLGDTVTFEVGKVTVTAVNDPEFDNVLREKDTEDE